MCATHSSRKFKPNKHFSSLKYVYIQCVYNIWCSILSRVTSTTIRQPWFHCIISDWCFSNAEIDSVVKAAVCVCVVGACVVMTALSMCWMVHSVFAPRRTPCGVASMPVLELRAASGRTTQTNAISLRNGFSHFFFFFSMLSRAVYSSPSQMDVGVYVFVPNNEKNPLQSRSVCRWDQCECLSQRVFNGIINITTLIHMLTSVAI